METSNYLALAVKPLDVATPLLNAAKIRQSQVEAQQQQTNMHRDAIGAELRGLSVIADKPEFPQAWAQSVDKLVSTGALAPNVGAMYRDNASPLLLKQLQAQYTTPDLAFRQAEANRAQGNTDRSFDENQRQFNVGQETKNLSPGFVKTPTGQTFVPGGPADPKYIEATNAAKDKTAEQIREREQAVIARGLDPKDPQYRSYVLTGKMPREDQQPLTATDKKAILEADEMVLANENVITNLKEAKDLSKSAYDGVTASQRAWIVKQFGGQGGIDTANLNNLVIGNALTQLKSTFGAAPTEGERKILLELQGSVNEPDAVRQKIFDRAVILAEKRLAFNKQRSAELRGGTFYKPGEKSPAGKAQDRVTTNAIPQNDSDPIAEARIAIAKGVSRAKVEEILKKNGVKYNPADLDLQ